MEIVAEEVDCEIDTDILQAREAGLAIVDEAVERGINLILMGVTYGTRFGQFSLGNVVPYVLKNAPCRVILYHQPTLLGIAIFLNILAPHFCVRYHEFALGTML